MECVKLLVSATDENSHSYWNSMNPNLLQTTQATHFSGAGNRLLAYAVELFGTSVKGLAKMQLAYFWRYDIRHGPYSGVRKMCGLGLD